MNRTFLYPRLIESYIAEALLDTPVALLASPLQAGKTTLVRQIAQQQSLRYLTMDDELALLSAREDPVGMIPYPYHRAKSVRVRRTGSTTLSPAGFSRQISPLWGVI